jgi:hypothetical protein
MVFCIIRYNDNNNNVLSPDLWKYLVSLWGHVEARSGQFWAVVFAVDLYILVPDGLNSDKF